MHELIVDCRDCDGARARLAAGGFEVQACEPADGGRCRLRFAEAPPARPARSPRLRGRGGAAEVPGLTPTQVRTAQAIVNLFETGVVLGHYGQVTLIPGDTGHLTYGRSQTTLGSGHLHDLLADYCANPGAALAAPLLPELPRFAARDTALDEDTRVHNLLRACADDRVMREVQDAFFDSRFWEPALRAANAGGITTPLGVAVVYDSWVHGAWVPRRNEVLADLGPASEAGEAVWVARYVERRRAWLGGHSRSDLRATVYRMDAFQRLIDQGRWGLELPLVVRGAEISTDTLAADPPGCYEGPPPGSRTLSVARPLMRGLDVRRLQLGLSGRGMQLGADGVFGQTTQRVLRGYQLAMGLPPTGVAEPALIGELAL